MEKIYLNLFDVLSLFGGFLAFLLGCIFIFHEKFQTKSNTALAISLFSVFLMIVRFILLGSEGISQTVLVSYLPIFYVYLIPLGLYYCIVYLLKPQKQLEQKDYWLIAPIFFVVFFDSIVSFFFLFKKSLVLANPDSIVWYYSFIYFTIIIYFFVMLFLSWRKLNEYQNQLLNNYSFIEGKDLDWFRKVTVIIFIITLVFVALRISVNFFPMYVYTFSRLFYMLTTAVVCFTAFNVIINQNFYLVPQFKEKSDTNIPQKALSEKTDLHYQHLLNLMKQDKLYQDAELNMDTLSEKVQLSKSYLSRIINQKEGKNFYDFVNTFRVEEVKSNLDNPAFAHYSILGIGLDAGFKSKSTFNTVFKKMVGMTPSAYKKTLKR